MFKKPTVFVLGAGASWHYGYPTGEHLVREVYKKELELERYFKSATQHPIGVMPKYVLDKLSSIDLPGGNERLKSETAWSLSAVDCSKLSQKLRNTDPLVIDYFLGQNPEIQKLGKMLIAWVIRERETAFHDTGRNINRPMSKPSAPNASQPEDNWIRFIIHRLVVGCSNDLDLATNRVNFVTFNYDVSLEDSIIKGLRNNSTFTFGGIDKFLAGDRFIHVYGKIRSDIKSEFVRLQPLKDPNLPQIDPRYAQSLLDDLLNVSQGIRTIDPHEKNDDEIQNKIRSLTQEAQCLYILGFGFDRNNSARVGFEPGNLQLKSGQPSRSVMFTNFGDINRINKAASRAFFGEPNAFLSDTTLSRNFSRHYYEKSIRDCYGALAYDFDELEEY